MYRAMILSIWVPEDDNVIGKEGNAEGDMMVGEALQELVFDNPLNQSVQDVMEITKSISDKGSP